MRDDADFNISFCEAMEKYPELYDYTRTDYCNRIVQDRAWTQIAIEVNESEADCKERWKNIRGRYAKNRNEKKRNINLPPGSKVVKDYYLTPHLQFLNGFIKCRAKRIKLDNNINDQDESTYHPQQPSSSAINTDIPNSPNPAQNEQQKITLNYHKQMLKLKRDNEDSDFCFLKSLLPDMKAMSPKLKRKFKIMVLNTASKLLEKSEAHGNEICASPSRESSTSQQEEERNDMMWMYQDEIKIELEEESQLDN